MAPVASLQYVNLGINSFGEDGPTALNIQSQSVDSLRSQFGVEARYALRTGSVIVTPHISASWQHEFLDGSEGITSQFNQVGSGSFTVQTTNPERDSAFIDLGLDAQVDKEITLFVDYETEAGQSNFFAQSVQAGLKIGFLIHPASAPLLNVNLIVPSCAQGIQTEAALTLPKRTNPY